MKNTNLNIGMILDGFYPSDIRVRKEAESLAKEFNVYILCVKNSHESEYEVLNNVHIIRAISYKNFTQKGIIDIVIAINFTHALFKKQLDSFITTNSIDVLHVHDLPLAETIYQAAKKHSLKTVLDLHENYPEALKTWFSWRRSYLIKLKNYLFFNFKRWANYEKKMLRKFDFIIAVVQEMKERIQTNHQIKSSKITIINNSEKKDFAKVFNGSNAKIFQAYTDRYIIAYVGGIGPHRGLQTAIRAIKQIRKEIPNVLLAIIGPAHKDVIYFLKQLVKKEGVENEVRFFGSQPFLTVPQIMQTATINIIPHEKNEHTNSTIPHKLFQILMSGKPLLVSDCKPFQRIVGEKDIGWIFKAGNPLHFSKKIIEIHNNKGLSKKRCIKGMELCLQGELNWETTAVKLIEFYKRIRV